MPNLKVILNNTVDGVEVVQLPRGVTLEFNDYTIDEDAAAENGTPLHKDRDGYVFARAVLTGTNKRTKIFRPGTAFKE